MDVATRADRTHYSEAVPVSDSWGSHSEWECGEVGFFVSRWLRQRLSGHEGRRARVFEAMKQLLRDQLAEESRHLRRLHMHGLRAGPGGWPFRAKRRRGRWGREYADRGPGQRLSGPTDHGDLQHPPKNGGGYIAGSFFSLEKAASTRRRRLNNFYEGSLETILEPLHHQPGSDGGAQGQVRDDSGEGDQRDAEPAGMEMDEDSSEMTDEEMAMVQGYKRPSSTRRTRRTSESRSRWRPSVCQTWIGW